MLAPDRQAFSNATTWSICTADDVFTPRVNRIDEVDCFAGVRVGQRARFHFASMLPVAHVGEVARQHVFAHVASVAVVIGLAEAEQVAIVAGVPLIIVDRQLLQRLRGGA